MKTLTFETNVTNSDGVASVTPLLNAIESLDSFNVETAIPIIF